MLVRSRAGKVKHLGLSKVSASTLHRMHAVHLIAAIEVEYLPSNTEGEAMGLLKTARELCVEVVAYSPPREESRRRPLCEPILAGQSSRIAH
jgi:aryl-alcohol dehydrogenase-like predicted oxidoreductase